ncbi:hypothetical protein K7432_000050 [Basidiobolus ranarum]|uniref:Uncharacterized protein n=1 Tax=Basidiobolus ranarum TaxID=34480 RepID=A0ABR2X588_9FUNG
MWGKNLITLAILSLACAVNVQGHSYLTGPDPRVRQGQCRLDGKTFTGSNPKKCSGPCESTVLTPLNKRAVYQRGQELSVSWARNNHPGGFVRLAFAKTSKSGSSSEFDKNVHKYSCYEAGPGCRGQSDKNNNDKLGGSTKNCNTAIYIPKWLEDGEWTLQWSWYGSMQGHGDFYSCSDIVIKGGPKGASQGAAFEGGDPRNPNKQLCAIGWGDRLGVCKWNRCWDTQNKKSREPFVKKGWNTNVVINAPPYSKTPLKMLPGRNPATNKSTPW